MQPVEQRLRLATHGFLVEQETAGDLTTEEDVFFDSQMFGKIELLMDHHDAGRFRSLGFREGDGFAV